jgi:dienelactone hydrolase
MVMQRLLRILKTRSLALAALLCALGTPVAGLELLQTTGRFVDGNAVKLRMLTDIPANSQAILLDVPNYSAAPVKTLASGEPTFATEDAPMTRLGRAMKADGVGYALLDLPSDITGRPSATWWENPDHHRDISAALKALRGQYPQSKLYLSGYVSSARSVLAYAAKGTELMDGVVLLSPALDSLRNVRLSEKIKGLVIQVATARCYASSLPSTQELMDKSRLQLLTVYYDKWGNPNACAADSQAGLTRQVGNVAPQLTAWLQAKAIPAQLGDPKVGTALNEEVRMLQGSSGKVEVTLYKPTGVGPFPLLIWNHGDVETGSVLLSGARFREPLLANEFVDMGLAVAVVARPGVGKSEGTYRTGFSTGDADATYKGRVHAKELLAVLPELQQIAWVDKSKLLLSGQSAGGFAVLTALAMNIPGLLGVIDYAGGRTDMSSVRAASHSNTVMINAFGEVGKAASAPLLMVFAENDSRYTANTIRESYQAFTQSGGKATLALYPPLAGDGHFVHHQPTLWRDDVRKFLQSLGITPTASKN